MTQPNRDDRLLGADAPEPVAVIGMGCRFPGADNVEAYWELLRSGREAIREVPANRYLDLGELIDPRTGEARRIATRRGGFLEQVDQFDPYVFNISPREASLIDPQQRLLLETAWEALEDAGQDLRRLAGSRTAVYVGIWSVDYEARMIRATRNIDHWMITGGSRHAASGRLSFAFDLRGPSQTIDTACSSSLVAIHVACQALRSGECDLALAGGANVILDSATTIAYTAAGALSRDGRCKFGDESADGFVRSEGAAMLILKPLAKALADGDHVHAVICGGAVTNNGQTGGSLMAPGEEGQVQLLREAYAHARVSPLEIDYVEAHGTGTRVGDPMELRALGRILAEGRAATSAPCLVGSVKTNIGHTESASGIAGLIKAILCLQHREVPASLHFHQPNSEVPWDSLPLKIVTDRTELQATGARALAGINSFGITGTFAHLIVEEGPAPPQNTPELDDTSVASAALVLPVSARSDEAVRQLLSAYAQRFAQDDASLIDLCASACLRRTHHDWRSAVVGRSRSELIAGLETLATGELAPRTSTGRRTPDRLPVVAFVFSGQGPQWPGMGVQLLQSEPTFRRVVEQIDEMIRAEAGWSVLRELELSARDTRLNQTLVAQPAIFAIQVGLAELLRSWGVVPAAVVGHSVGEAAAAYISGALSLDDAVRTICRRARIMQQGAGLGRMAAVELTEDEASAILAPYSEQLSIAAVNGPRSVTLSGDPDALLAVCAEIESGGRFCRPLDVAHAFHSAQLDPYLGEMEAAVAEIQPRRPVLPLYSTVRGDLARDGDFGAGYWPGNLRATVRFSDAITRMADAGCDVFVELGPHPALGFSLKQTLASRPERCAVLGTLRRDGDEPADLRGTLAELYTLGLDPDWRALNPPHARYVPLPTYAWQRESFWIDETSAATNRRQRRRRDGKPAYPLLQQYLSPAGREAGQIRYWEGEISLTQFPWLGDHRVAGRPILPAAAMILTALAAAEEALGDATLGECEFVEAIFLDPERPRTLQLSIAATSSDQVFELFSLAEGADNRNNGWRKHAFGSIAVSASAEASPHFDLDAARGGCRRTIPGAAHYRATQAIGLDYGPTFQMIDTIWVGDGEAISSLVPSPAIVAEQSDYGIHPATLDACFQTMLAILPQETEPLPMWLPERIQGARLWSQPEPGELLWARVVARPGSGSGSSIVGDAFLMAESGRIVLEVTGLSLRRVERALHDANDMFFEARWLHRSLPIAPQSGSEEFAPLPEQLASVLRSARSERVPIERVLGARAGLDRLAGQYIITAFQALGFSFSVGRRFRADELITELSIALNHLRLITRLLGILSDDGVLGAAGDDWEVLATPSIEDPDRLCFDLATEYPEFQVDLQLFRRCGANLAEALLGRINAVELLFSSEAVEFLQAFYNASPFLEVANLRVRRGVEEIVERLPAGRTLRVLELGAGLGGLTGHVLPVLPAGRARFTFTDVSPFYLSRARGRFGHFPSVDYELLDLEKDPIAQGFAAHSFDLILAANVLHATRDLRRTLANVRRLLAPSGSMILIEESRPGRYVDLIFGLTDGWWHFVDTDLRPKHPLLSASQWEDLLPSAGFATAATVSDEQDAHASTVVIAQEPIASRSAPAASGRWLILADQGSLATRLAEALGARGEDCTLTGAADGPIDHAGHVRLTQEFIAAAPDRARGVIDLRALDVAIDETCSSGDLARIQRRSIERVLWLAQALASLTETRPPRLVLVTRGSQATGPDCADLALAQTTAWNTIRVVGREHPELRPLLFDLEANTKLDEVETLVAELLHSDGEDEVAIRGGNRLVRRLVHYGSEAGAARRLVRPPGPFHVVVGDTGSLDDITVRNVQPRQPGPGEVQISVRANGLNFRDLLVALGAIDTRKLVYEQRILETIGLTGVHLTGYECSGIVTAVGEGVVDLAVGDGVMAVSAGAFCTDLTTSAAAVVRTPSGLSFEQAACLPIAYLTAAFALRELGGIRRGDRVLIHSAAGGVGIAAIHIAHAAGAEVFGTAGSPRKQEFVRSLGVEHVFDSRSLGFADKIREITRGRGVDIALNSFSGDFISETFAVLAPGGRFIEIGKRGVWSHEEAARARPDVTYEILDLARMSVESPESLAPVFRRLREEFAGGVLPPLPVRSFSLHEAGDAFRFMQQARHIGKLAITQPAWGVRRSVDAPDAFASGTWLITGAFGGIGRSLVQWLVARGARNLVLTGRNLPSGNAADEISALDQRGIRVIAAACDVAHEDALRRLLEQVRETLPPLRGVFHLAGLLDDGAVLQQSWDRFATVYGPKVLGSWNLHRLTRHLPLDCFVLYSSWAALIGSPGQANHASANQFMDSLVWYRQSIGLPGLSINWGAWTEVGAAVRHDVTSLLARKGIGSFSPAQGHAALGRLLSDGARQASVSPLDVAAWRAAAGTATAVKLTELLAVEANRLSPSDGAATTGAVPLREALLAANPGSSRRQVLESRLQEHIARVLRMPAARLDARRSFKDMGLDSLTALELRNHLDTDTGLKLPATLFWNHPTVAELALELAGKMSVSLDADNEKCSGHNGVGDGHTNGDTADGKGAADDEAELRELLDELERLPADEARRILAEGSSAGEAR